MLTEEHMCVTQKPSNPTGPLSAAWHCARRPFFPNRHCGEERLVQTLLMFQKRPTSPGRVTGPPPPRPGGKGPRLQDDSEGVLPAVLPAALGLLLHTDHGPHHPPLGGAAGRRRPVAVQSGRALTEGRHGGCEHCADNSAVHSVPCCGQGRGVRLLSGEQGRVARKSAGERHTAGRGQHVQSRCPGTRSH